MLPLPLIYPLPLSSLQNELQLNFEFNVSAISLETKQLTFQFRVDGPGATVNASREYDITLDAVAGYSISIG